MYLEGKGHKSLREQIPTLLKDIVFSDEFYQRYANISIEVFRSDDYRLVRSIWTNPADNTERILLDIYENALPERAKEVLSLIRSENQRGDLPSGPADLGESSFIHPEGEPPAVFWAQGKYCIAISSFGKTKVQVIELALLINRLL